MAALRNYIYESSHRPEDIERYLYNGYDLHDVLLSDPIFNQKECMVIFSEYSKKLLKFRNNKELAAQVIRAAKDDVCLNEYTSNFEEIYVKFQSFNSKFNCWIDLEKGVSIPDGSLLRVVFVFKNVEKEGQSKETIALDQGKEYKIFQNSGTTIKQNIQNFAPGNEPSFNLAPRTQHNTESNNFKNILRDVPFSCAGGTTAQSSTIPWHNSLQNQELCNGKNVPEEPCIVSRYNISDSGKPNSNFVRFNKYKNKAATKYNGDRSTSDENSSESGREVLTNSSSDSEAMSSSSIDNKRKSLKKYRPSRLDAKKRSTLKGKDIKKDRTCRRRSRSYEKKWELKVRAKSNKTYGSSPEKTSSRSCIRKYKRGRPMYRKDDRESDTDDSSKSHSRSSTRKYKQGRPMYRKDDKESDTDDSSKSHSRSSTRKYKRGMGKINDRERDRSNSPTRNQQWGNTIGKKQVKDFPTRSERRDKKKNVSLKSHSSDGEEYRGETRNHERSKVKYEKRNEGDSNEKGSLEQFASIEDVEMNQAEQKYKNPISVLFELCQKLKWKAPEFQALVEEMYGTDPRFKYKVILNGQSYAGKSCFSRRQEAKADAALACLRSLNHTPKDI